MDQPQQTQGTFRCPRCQHTEPETTPHRSDCPRCGWILPRPEQEDFEEYRRRSLALRLMTVE